MKLVLFASVAIALASCQTTPKEDYSWIKKGAGCSFCPSYNLQQKKLTEPVSFHVQSALDMTWISSAAN